MKSKLLFTIKLFCIFSFKVAASNDLGSLPPSASISYNSPICTTLPFAPVTLTGTAGGIFTAYPVGLQLDAASGMISPGSSLLGTYMVTYSVAASGPNPAFTTTTNVTISSSVTPIFTFSTHNVCAGGSVPALPTISTNGIAGAWSPSSVNSTISATYVFTPGTGQCATSIVEIFTATPAPFATISPSMTICGESAAAIVFTGTPNAVVAYTFNGGSSQTIVLAVSGTASITSIVGVNAEICLQYTSLLGCTTNLSACSIITVVPNPAGTDRSISICDSDMTPVNLAAVLVDEQPGGTWTRTGGTGGTFNAATATFTAVPTATTSIFTYTNSNGLCGIDTSIVKVNIISQLSFSGTFPDITACDSFALAPLEIGDYYTEPNGGGSLLQVGTYLNYSQTVYVFAQSASCTAEDFFQVVIFQSIVPMFPQILDLCAGSLPPSLPTTSANGLAGTWSPSTINTLFPGTTTYIFTPDTFECAVTIAMVITVIPCGGISLNAFFDANNNGIEESSEIKFPLGQFHYEMNANGLHHHAMAPNGMYTIYDGNSLNTYNISYSINAPYDTLYNISTPSYTNVSPDLSFPVYNFPVTVLQPYTDLQITLVPQNAPRPGMHYQNTIVFSNQGNTAMTSGSVTFVKDPVVSITSVSEPGIVTTPNGFRYDFINLAAFESRTVNVTLQVPVIPAVALGQLLTNSVTIENPDMSIANNSSLTQQIIGSYDPNDITESHGNKIVFSEFTPEDYLYYTIRFENTGNAEAIDVRIGDDLDVRLDEASVRLVSASHAYALERTDSHLEFRFNDIMLAPSVPESMIGKGFVTFKIKPKPGYAVGDIISNAAAIFFDFNPAVETNTFQTEFVSQLGVNEFENNAFRVYPNPATEKVTVSANGPNPIAAIAIYDVLGKKVFSQNGNGSGISETINIESLETGIYFLKITTADNHKSTRKLLVK